MKKTISISIIISMLLLMLMPWQGFAASAPGYDTSRYIGEYYLPSEVGRAHFGVRLNIYEIADNYISFDYQRPAAGHAIHFTTEPAYFENEYTARANGTVAYADQLDNTTPLEFVLTLSYDHITVECIRDGMSIATDEFYLTRKGDFSKSNRNRQDDKFDLCFDDYYIMVQDKTLNVVDLNTYENTVISNNASWNFISDGYDLYYYEYTKPEYTVKKLSLSTLKSQTLFSANSVFLVDCEDNTLLYYYNETDDAEATMVSTYDIPTGRRSNIDEYYFSIKISNNRVVYDGVRGDYAPVDLYVSDPDGSNKVLISDRSFVSEVYDGYIYYAEALDESYHASFEVKRCDLYGNNSVVLATVPSTRKAVIGVNPDYVEYQNWEAGDGAEERVYYNTGAAQSAERPITVKINDTAVTFDQPPIIYNDRTLVPLRAIFEALGATVTWDGETQTVTAEKGGTTIKLTIGEYGFYKNGSAISLDVPGMIVNDRTLVPVRAVSEAFDCTVDWDGDTQTVTIQTNTEQEIQYYKTFAKWLPDYGAITGRECEDALESNDNCINYKTECMLIDYKWNEQEFKKYISVLMNVGFKPDFVDEDVYMAIPTDNGFKKSGVSIKKGTQFYYRDDKYVIFDHHDAMLTIETYDGISPNDMNLIFESNQAYLEPTPWETGKYEEAFTVGDYTYYYGPLRDENGVDLRDGMYALCMYNNKTREDVSIMYRPCRADLIGNKVFAIGNGVSSGWWDRQLVIYDIGAKEGNKIVSGVYMPFALSDEPYFTYNDRIYVCHHLAKEEGNEYIEYYGVISLDMNGENVRVEVEPVRCGEVELHETYAIIGGTRYDYKYASNNEISVTLNGEKIEFDQPPVIIDDRTLVPLRAICEAMGCNVKWNPDTQLIEESNADAMVLLTVGSKNYLYQGYRQSYETTDVAPTIMNGRTLIPARLISENFGAIVDWDANERCVKISYDGDCGKIKNIWTYNNSNMPDNIEGQANLNGKSYSIELKLNTVNDGYISPVLSVNNSAPVTFSGDCLSIMDVYATDLDSNDNSIEVLVVTALENASHSMHCYSFDGNKLLPIKVISQRTPGKSNIIDLGCGAYNGIYSDEENGFYTAVRTESRGMWGLITDFKYSKGILTQKEEDIYDIDFSFAYRYAGYVKANGDAGADYMRQGFGYVNLDVDTIERGDYIRLRADDNNNTLHLEDSKGVEFIFDLSELKNVPRKSPNSDDVCPLFYMAG